MEKLSGYAFVAGMLSTGLAIVFYLLYALSGLRSARMQTAGMQMSTGSMGFVSGPRTAAIGRYATMLGWLAVFALLASLTFRTIATGHGPFANMYEFSVAFGFGIITAYMWFERKYHQRILALIALPVALAMMLYAWSIQGPVEFSGWFIVALALAILFTVLAAVGLWVVIGGFMYARFAGLPPGEAGADQPSAPPPRIDYRH